MLDETSAATLEAVLGRLNDALERGDPEAAAALFQADSYWRDLVAFTWNIRTLEGPEEIRAMLREPARARRELRGIALDRSEDAEHAQRREPRAGSPSRPRSGAAAAMSGSKDGKISTLFTALIELKGFEEQTGATPADGHRAWRVQGPRDLEAIAAAPTPTSSASRRQPYVLIVGGGQGGIGLGARLRRLGVPTLIVDAHARPGDCLAQALQVALPARSGLVRPSAVPAVPRSLADLHAQGQDGRLARSPTPRSWSSITGARRRLQARDLGRGGRRSGRSRRAQRQGGDAAAEASRARDRHVGLPGDARRSRRGRLQGQAASFLAASAAARAMPASRCVVIGSNNSAHDIAPTCGSTAPTSPCCSARRRWSCAPRRCGRDRPLYSEQALAKGITTEKADFIVASLPYALQPRRRRAARRADPQERDADFYDALEKAGFKLDFGEDETGIVTMYMRRGSGYYIDVGASELIADGAIKLVTGRRSTA